MAMPAVLRLTWGVHAIIIVHVARFIRQAALILGASRGGAIGREDDPLVVLGLAVRSVRFTRHLIVATQRVGTLIIITDVICNFREFVGGCARMQHVTRSRNLTALVFNTQGQTSTRDGTRSDCRISCAHTLRALRLRFTTLSIRAGGGGARDRVCHVLVAK
jgi:hypothetical protein